MTRSDRIALLLSLLAILAGYLVHDRVFEHMAHLEDEMAYAWQAQAIAGGHLTLASPPNPKSFLIPFVVDYNGLRFGKYPPGWPAALAIGEFLGARSLANPLLAGLGVWLSYLLAKRLFGETVALLTGVLTLTSPFFLLNSGSLLSHPFSLVLSAAFVLGWLDAFVDGRIPARWLPALTAGSSLGLLALVRPLTAVSIGLPFAIHGAYLLLRGDWATRKRLVGVGLLALFLGLLVFMWQYAVTGDPRLNPYTLWWPYDKIGFGPGHGHDPAGHSLYQAWINTKYSLYVGYRDLFGWGQYSWIFLPFGLLAVLFNRNGRALLVISIIPSLVLVYLTYWIGSSLFGPRYYYEGLYCLTMISGAGIASLAGWPTRPGVPFPNYAGWRKLQPLAVTLVVGLLISGSVLYYIPLRLQGMFGLYGVQRSHLEPFQTASAQELTPALIIVHTKNSWVDYGTLIELQNAFLTSPFIFAISRGPSADTALAADFSERNIYHYYPVTAPYRFYETSEAAPAP